MNIIGIIFIIIGVINFLIDIINKLKCKETVIGQIINICKVSSIKGDGSRKRKFYPIFQYNVDGTTYVKKSTNGSIFYRYEIGENVKIKYNPKNPNKYYVKGQMTNIIMSMIWIIIGVMIILAGQRV